tara:strand:+ start:252 stop:443 length:192 start_codon:yes stop_codon:yes gene_type:complete
MKSKRFTNGKCPNCESVNLDYEPEQYYQDSLTYQFTCSECGLVGREWYNIEYSETTIDVGAST